MAIHAQANCKLTTKPAKTSLLGGHFIYKTTPSSSGKTLQSANVVQTIEKNGIDVTDDPTKWDYNVNIGSNGIKIRNNETTLSEWTNLGLTFYKPNTNIVAASVSSSGLNIIEGTINLGNNFSVTTNGTLTASNANITGDITATSLTINNDSDEYDGVAAINISGYDIEIISDSTGVVDVDNTTYLYPVLYHNGIKVEEYILSTDSTVDELKVYYTRSGSEGSYIYTVVTPEEGDSPLEEGWYEEQIHYDEFIWYQDDIEPGTAGDASNKGRYLATYGHNYRVIYDFDDGAVGEGIQIQTRTVDPSKYITKISDTGITIHPEVWTNQSSYIQLDGNGMGLFNSNGSSIAQYGSTARVGLNNSSRFLMNSNSLEAYDSNNNKYFEVNNNGLSWGTKTAATTDQVSTLADDVTDAAKTATNYITTITGGGISVHDENDENNYAKIDANGLEVFNDIENISTSVAKFGSTSRIGRSTSSRFLINASSLQAYNSSGTKYFEITDGGMSANLITSGKISSADGEVYFDLDNNTLVCSRLVGQTTAAYMDGYTYGSTYYGNFRILHTGSGSYGLYIEPNKNNGTVWISADNRIILESAPVGTKDGDATKITVGTQSIDMYAYNGPGGSFVASVQFGYGIGSGAVIFLGGNTRITGNMTATGTKSRLVDTNNYSSRLLYCYETPTPLFGDIGEAHLDNDGYCYVDIDDIFSETIAEKVEYQVFLQKEGDGDCWISDKQSNYFVIQGTPNLKVAWELKAKQKDYEMIRLESVDLIDMNDYYMEQEEALYGND